MIPAWHDDGPILIPEQRLDGTVEQKLAQVDEAIAALVGFRAWLASSQIVLGAPTRREQAAHSLRRLVRF
jgi:hypothetical protein